MLPSIPPAIQNLSTPAKLAGASIVSGLIYAIGRKFTTDENAAALAVGYGIIVGGYIAKTR